MTIILRRITHHLKAQNWTAIVVEFAFVVLGVFLGVAAANWNVERLEKRETQQLLSQLDHELEGFVRQLSAIDDYYAITGRFADRAVAGWRGDGSVNDEEFVIAAYQASQITAAGGGMDVWAEIFGAGNLREIDDIELRQNLARLMTFDYGLVTLPAVATRYREEVRKMIPNEVQAAIRAHCGDRELRGGILVLPATCDVELPAGPAGEAAAALRARPELVAELHWHRAAVANQLFNIGRLVNYARELTRQIESPADRGAEK